MTPIPQAVWLKVADRRKLRSWWAEVMFNLEDEEQAQAIQEAVNQDLLASGVPEMAILAYQTILPLLLEAPAISTFLETHPQYRNALPEILNRQEAVALAKLEWPTMTPQEIKALTTLLPATMGETNRLWIPAIRRFVEPPKPRPASQAPGQADALNSHPLNQAALSVLRKGGAEDKPDRAYLLQLAAWFLEDGQGNPADEDDDGRLVIADLLRRTPAAQLAATRTMESCLTPEEVAAMPPAEVADLVAYQFSRD
jgi:hypothetical protein